MLFHTCCWAFGFLSDSGTMVIFVKPFFSLSGFKSCDFDFCEGDALMTHQLTSLRGQSVACSLLDRLETWLSRS